MQKHENDGASIVSCRSAQAHEQKAFSLYLLLS